MLRPSAMRRRSRPDDRCWRWAAVEAIYHAAMVGSAQALGLFWLAGFRVKRATSSL
jgi:hypothetical protein